MKHKAILFSLVSILALAQPAHGMGMDILNYLENAVVEWNQKPTKDKVKLGLLIAGVTGGLIAANVVYDLVQMSRAAGHMMSHIRARINKSLEITDLFFIKDVTTRYEKVREYFMQNPELIGAECVFPQPSTVEKPGSLNGRVTPFALALQIKDFVLALWLMEHGAQSENGWTIELLKKEICNIEAYENHMDEYCIPYVSSLPLGFHLEQ